MTPADYEFTMESLGKGGTDRDAVEEAIAGDIDRLNEGDTYDDVLDRLEGPWQVNGEWRQLGLPAQTNDPIYRRLLGIAKQVRRETRD